MANIITGNPWYLDTTGFAFKTPVFIKQLIWDSITPGSSLIILDNAGRTILNNQNTSTDSQVIYNNLGWVYGFNLTQLTSGNLSVFINR